MPLSVTPSVPLGAVPPLGGDESGSPYGSLIGRPQRAFKKQPVLMLDPEELAKAHLAIAMGGSEIMEAQGDPAAAVRPRPSASLLGLAPMGADEEPGAAARLPAPAKMPALTKAPALLPPAPVMWSSVLPTIKQQVQRNREREAEEAAKLAAPSPPQENQENMVARGPLGRLEIDDWTQAASLKAFTPPQERDLPPAPRSVVASEPEPEPVVEALPEFVEQPAAIAPEPEPVPVPVPVPVPGLVPPQAVAGPDIAEEKPILADSGEREAKPEVRREAVLEPNDPELPLPSNSLRSRVRDHAARFEAEPDDPPSLLERLWSWWRGRSF